MPKGGFYLKTGGSAKRRIVKPLIKQSATTSFPINTTYKVTGVPGHTHSSSAVLGLTVDLKRNRGSDQKVPEEWAYEEIEHKAAEAGDSIDIENEDEMYQRALERGIGDICLRPENCHQEIREPVRSIGEVRRLVAPDDRLKTMTYVEEVGGFVNPDGKPYISNYPDVYVNILGINNPGRLRYASGDEFGSNNIVDQARLENASKTDGADQQGRRGKRGLRRATRALLREVATATVSPRCAA